MSYYDESYPPSILNFATQANAGIPGTWVPSDGRIPATAQDLITGHWVTVVASPTTPWTTGQYVQTAEPGPAGRATWTGTNWVGGAAPLESETPQPQSETPSTESEYKAVPIDREELPPDTTVAENPPIDSPES